MKVEFSPPDISQREIDEVVDTLKSGWITTGPKTKLFEKNIADFCNVDRAVCLNSATASMEMTLRLLGIGKGDEVITTAYTYSASASVIHHVGAKIVMVDTLENSYHIDYESLEKAITSKTKAMIPVDVGGVMCDYDKIFEIVNRKRDLFNPSNELQERMGRITVIADAAHSLGAVYKGNVSGEVADFTCFSMHAVKNLTTAEGGAVVWRDIEGVSNEDIYSEYMLLSLHGQSKDALEKSKVGQWEYDIVAPNYKCNMTDIMASIGLAQLERYPDLLKKRKELIMMYDELLNSDRVQKVKHFSDEYKSSGHLYMVRLIDKDEDFRNHIITEMARKGISTNVHYKPLPLHTAYKDLGFQIEGFPNAFKMYENEITLPLHTKMTTEQVKYVCQTLLSLI
ncbi:capsular biosynthesis protein [Sporosarcina sp. P20a]|uniref:DegT/DnrJ/EryC1/StrS family aminotransferase n=1 Tax=Sporosarcina sp. P20a TaxID=2048256 RepID=UPI000C164255|nr:DegT/DnrJ/EryC1/StrS family aminotransferase [Sporosarcina sp. P20a]PIC85453.1 capsular biosynthesis protein [Sporosarcina sp. P20a]